jgi:hypothetical protein
MSEIVATAHLTRPLTPAELRTFTDGWNQLIVRTNNPDLSGASPPAACLIPSDALVQVP